MRLTWARENSRPAIGYKEKGGDKKKGREGGRRRKNYLDTVPIS